MIRLLVEGFVSSTLLAAIVTLLCLLAKRLRVGPAACHALWVVVLIKLLLPPLLAWPWAFRDAAPAASRTTTPAGLVHQAQWWLLLDLEPAQAPRTGAAAPTHSPAPTTPSPIAPTAAPIPAAWAPATTPPTQPWLTPAHLRTSLLSLWLAGAAAFLLLQILSLLRLRRQLHLATTDPHLTAQVVSLAAELHLPAPRACRLPAADSPCIWAFFPPLLLWPADLDCASPDARGLLAHELAHLRRRDHWVGWLALLAGILWWWNPVYWFLRRELHRNAELCCDAWAVRLLKGSRRTYASALIDVSARAVARRAPALALGVRATRRQLEGRLTMIMTGNPTVRPGLAAWALAATLLALTLPAWSQAAATQTKIPFTLSKSTTALTQPLLPDGTPDYLAALNAKYAKDVTPENNAFLPFMKIRGTAEVLPDPSRPEILKLLGAPESPPDETHYSSFAAYLTTHPSSLKPDDATNIIVAAQRELWTPADHPELAAYLQAQAPILDLAVEASKRPHFYCPFVAPNGNLTEATIPRATGQVDFFRAWIIRPTLRAAAGDIDGAAADLRAIKQLARLFPQQGTIIFTLVGYVADTMATDAASIIAASGKLTPAQCDALARALDLPPMPSLADIYGTGERWRALQLFQWTAMGKFNQIYGRDLDPKSTAWFNSIDLTRLDGDLFLKSFNALRDREVAVFASTSRKFIDAMSKSIEQDVRQWADVAKSRGDSLAPDVGESRSDYTLRVLHTILSTVTPRIFSRVTDLLNRQLQSAMLPALFAAAKFKAQTGAWPQSLDQLLPAYVKQIPNDPYAPDNAKIQYLLINNHPRLFSLGPDATPNTPDDLLIGIPLPTTTALPPTTTTHPAGLP